MRFVAYVMSGTDPPETVPSIVDVSVPKTSRFT